MSKLRKLLFPFSILYKSVTKTRNKLYDKGILNSNEFDTPLIVVGNLRIGGTGKSPMVAYLVKLLKTHYKIAVLSRGYKRTTKGFILADADATAKSIGDEPYQLQRQYPDILVAVDEDRTHGIHLLEKATNPPDLILLDDAFQHRQIKAEFNILLTSYDDLYTDDRLLPVGNLRESVDGADRAQVIVVTKCPDNFTEELEFETAVKLKPSMTQTVFFTRIKYAEQIQNEKTTISLTELKDFEIVLVTGIANPKPLLDFLDLQNLNFQHLQFPDHHNFSKRDLKNIQHTFDSLKSNKKIILTTEKDYVRIFASLVDLYYLAIETIFVNHQKDFDKLILNYVEQSTRNR